MTRLHEIENLIRVKTALAEKYEHLVRVRKSKPCKKVYAQRADDYRRAAANLAHLLR